jgi:rod shape-determining protein MreC
MESFFVRYRGVLVLMVLVLAQIIGLATQIRRPSAEASDPRGVRLTRLWLNSAIAPIEGGFNAVGGSIRHVWNNYFALRDVRHQNAQLQAEVDRLRMEQAEISEDAAQGRRLQSLLGFQEHYVDRTIAAQVIGTSGSEQSHVIYIDKGADAGLQPDMPVITPDGIVGKVREVYPHSAQVLEINDQTSGAGVMLATTRIRGVLRGNAIGQAEVINMLPDDRIKPGEVVLTSGGDQVFPRGLPVGSVLRVEPDPDRDPFVAIIVKPAADLARLEEVLVITQMSDQLPASASKDIAQSQADASNKSAAEVLADKLPTVDPNVDTSAQDQGTNGQPLPMRPPAPLHPDRFSPSEVPPAAALTPGVAVPAPPNVANPAPAPVAATPAPAAPVAAKAKPAAPVESTDSTTAPVTATPRVRPPSDSANAAPRTTTTPAAAPDATAAPATKPVAPRKPAIVLPGAADDAAADAAARAPKKKKDAEPAP